MCQKIQSVKNSFVFAYSKDQKVDKIMNCGKQERGEENIKGNITIDNISDKRIERVCI